MPTAVTGCMICCGCTRPNWPGQRSAADRDAAIDRLAAHALAAVRSASEMLYPHLLHLPDSDGEDRADGGAERWGALGFAAADAALAWLNAERANLVALVVLLARHGRAEVALRLSDRLAGYF